MKVLVADLFSEEGLKELANSGVEVHYDDKLNGDSLTKAMAEFQPNVLVVRSTKVTAQHIDADPKLQMVVRAGAGYDTIDVSHCSKNGIYLTNCPGKNSHAVAELTLGLILSIDRRIAEGVQLLKEGKWNKGLFANCAGIKGKTLGVVGLGSIGQLVIERAKAFEMEVLVHTRSKKEGLDKKLGFTYTQDLNHLLANSDVVSFHVPATPATNGLVNEALLAHMKPNAAVINTSRGTLVNEADLHAHLEKNPEFWYGTDVFQGEPSVKEGPFDHALA